MRRLLTVILLIAIASFAFAKPERPPPPRKDAPPKKATLPDLRGETNWGTLTQPGRIFHLHSHPQWDGLGMIRDDDSIFIMWTQLSDGCAAPGVYKVASNGELIGHWGFAGEVQIEKDGSLSGEVRHDHVHKVRPEPDMDPP